MLYLSPQSPFEPGSGLGDLRMPRGRPVKGVAAVAGAAVGPVFLHARTEIVVPERTITQDEVPAEIARLQQAKTNAVRELNELHTVAAEQLSERDAKAILTQVAMIADLTNMVTSSMKKDLRNVEAIFEKACQFFIGHYEKAEDPNLRAKSNDTRDIRNRILGHLLGQTSLSQVLLGEGQPPAVLVTPYLLPTEVFLLSPERVLAVCTDQGGPRDHTAVMCRMKGIPLVAGLADLSLNVAPGQEVAVDGFNGVVTIEPDDQAKSNLRATQKQYEIRSLQRPLSKNGARTRDRVPVTILANVERLQDVIRLKSKAIGGVGLFRSEFLFLERDTPPTEDDQYATFMAAAQAMHPRPLTIRTMDFGDDKWPRWDRLREKMGGNFAYGPKGIRLSLASEQNENIFRAHCRAILRGHIQF